MDYSGEDNSRKTLAFIVCLFLGFVYYQTVLQPYFYGKGQGSPARTSTGTVAQTQSSGVPVTDTLEGGAQVAAQGQASEAPAAITAAQRASGVPTQKQLRDAGLVSLENEELSLSISRLGGRVFALELNKLREEAGKGSPRLNLVKPVEGAPYPLGVYSGTAHDAWVEYAVEPNAVEPTGKDAYRVSGDTGSVVLKGRLPDGRAITKTVGLSRQGYLLPVSVELERAPADGSALFLEWTKLVSKDDSSLLDPYSAPAYTWFSADRAQRQTFHDFKDAAMEFGPSSWVSMADKYFMAALLSPSGPSSARGMRTGQVFRARLAGDDVKGEFAVFAGPKSYEELEKAGMSLERAIDFGYTGFIAAPLLWLLHFFYRIFANYGLAIVALTIVVRLALYPLNSASYRQMKAMQDLKPDMDRIREQIKDKQQQQLELMGLYKKKGVNPLGGCLPMFIQMPIFIGLYSALMLAVELRHAPYALWISDLSAPERLMLGNVGIPIMVILFVLSMLAQQWLTPSTMDAVQKRMMLIMPIVFGFMFMNFPAGLTLYWLTNNLISLGQQQAMRQFAENAGAALLTTFGTAVAVFAFAFLVSLFG